MAVGYAVMEAGAQKEASHQNVIVCWLSRWWSKAWDQYKGKARSAEGAHYSMSLHLEEIVVEL
jgi:hypothetical protein